MDAVTEVLLDRTREADKVTRMVIVSLVAHAALITAFAFMPNRWATAPPPDEHVMNISLAGAPGPVQGRNPISAKAVQEAVPETVKPKNDAPPALAKPEMVEPVKAAKPEPKTPAKPEPKKEVIQLHGSKPTQGAEVKAGVAKVETHGAAIPFGGLATGGGGAGQAYTDYADFCCPEYLQAVTDLIRKNWNSKQGQDGSNVVTFTVRRDGTIADVVVEQGTNQFLNLASQRAILITQRVPPLPAAFTPAPLDPASRFPIPTVMMKRLFLLVAVVAAGSAVLVGQQQPPPASPPPQQSEFRIVINGPPGCPPSSRLPGSSRCRRTRDRRGREDHRRRALRRHRLRARVLHDREGRDRDASRSRRRSTRCRSTAGKS